MQTEIKKWGNSAALRIPANLLAAAGLEINSPVEIEVSQGKLIVKPVESKQYSLEELLAQCPSEEMELSDEDKEWLNAKPVGKEEW